MAYLRSALANWRTTASAILAVAGAVAATGPVLGLSAETVRVATIIFLLGLGLGLVSAADAQRLAALESAVKRLPLPSTTTTPAPEASGTESETTTEGGS